MRQERKRPRNPHVKRGSKITHNSSHIIIENITQEQINGLPEDKQAKIADILEKANKEIDKVLDKNPNL